MSSESQPNWREHGIKIVASAQLDLNIPQTPGVTRAAAITLTRAGARDTHRSQLDYCCAKIF